MAMSVATELQSSICEPRAVLGPGGNRVRVSEGPKHKYEGLKKPPQRPRKEIPESVVRKNVSVDSSCSSDTSSTGSSPKTASPRRTVRHKSLRPAKLVSNDVVKPDGPPRRCEWITAYSDPHYISFHDEEWGVPVYDDKKLFELLVLSQSLAELSWPEILTRRDIFRNLFDNFDPSSIAKFDEKKLLSLKVNGIPILSQQKLRAIVDNAIQVVKIQQEVGSFSKYCWSFVNQKAINNGVRYGRQVPVKSPKAEVISKDLMKRGFRCVGPTVVYSFMQVAGIVNDHLVTCFRHKVCDVNAKFDPKLDIEKSKDLPK
ncbi:putative DNA-3-methyladenine glycosylase I [Rosa chinensis]|uniref:Putative DNA-3-methyladenine glycosylase I n=1 Tax=Rosa chinensis TaxID=74649 RepID=A0A2P6PYJ2_ROSCH|nr:probable GMP synthase [glutamine-hydrolyzing] [Rosa chinensis]PRQ26993.1 putative DNA-3-methyladenine glycosylase I [Rosa chinensis]